jgi:hypothetical protein
MVKLRYFIRTKPAFAVLLSFFFVLHGYVENYNFVPAKDALLLTGLYVAVTIVLTALSWLFFRNIIKAALFAFFLMAFHFFFGAVHDAAKEIFPGGFLSRYSFFLPLFFMLFLFLLLYLKKSNRGFQKTCYYLNFLMVTLLLFDTGRLVYKISSANEKTVAALPAEFSATDNLVKPDIYLVIADEYPGNSPLKEFFGFDNSAFEDSLRQRGFHTVPHSRSNYNYTPFSLASILNMDYLQLQNKDRGQSDIAYCYKLIGENRLLRFLQFHEYVFTNLSVFDFPGQPRRVHETFLPVKTRLITSQTFLSRIDRDLRFNLVTRFQSKAELKRLTYGNLYNNKNILQLTKELAEKKSGTPKFVYSHLMMPHYPYYFDKNGNEQPFEKLLEGNQSDKKAFIEYLQYCNQKFLELVDHILKNSSAPPVIILMGDHGFRHFKEPVDEDFHFQNLVSVYLPGRNYSLFNDSLTAVNLFRTILNSAFGQHLPLLADSTIYLKD